MIRRLVHNHISPHNTAFYKLLDELTKASGVVGWSFHCCFD